MGAARIHRAYSPFYAESAMEIDYAQTADVIFAAHLDYVSQKLMRLGHTEWEWSDLTFSPGIDAPTGVSATPAQPNSTGAIAITYKYQVTATDANGNESRASAEASATNDMSLSGNYNDIAWTAVPGAVSYTVYRGDNASPGYIGTSDTNAFKDRNLISIASDTPPRATNPFADENPSTVGLHQQRLWFGRTRSKPNGIWGSQSAQFENMDVSRPARASDAVSFALVSEQVNSVNQLSSLKNNLIALSADGVFSVSGGSDAAITPSAIVPQRQTGRGSTRLRPLVIDDVLFYQPAKYGEIRTLGYNAQDEDGLSSSNIAIFSPHLFARKAVVCWASQENPFSCIWAVLNDGSLLCFTWEQEHEVWGWTRMEIDGFVEQCAVITEGGYDRLYILVRRTIDGVERRFHERMALPHSSLETACHLDCAVTVVNEEPSNVVTGLHHLNGATVSAHADGFSYHGLVVEDGSVTLPGEYEATVVTVGLPYEGLIETLPPVATAAGGTAHVEPQNVGEVTVRCVDTKGLELSLDGERWTGLPERTGGLTAGLEDIRARDYEAPAPGHWEKGATLLIRQTEPFPAHVTAVFYELVVGSD